ncbi:MAG TPA: nicotinamide riboside transporter PnuC [Capsulimonadaceae bacterium]|jgi:nicotinamide mononucleotide transporter
MKSQDNVSSPTLSNGDEAADDIPPSPHFQCSSPTRPLSRVALAERIVFVMTAVAMCCLVIASAAHKVPVSLTEALGFVTGALCVGLTVKQNIWNWPIGIANNVFFVALFLQSRLFADMSLQVIYIILGLLGWYWWLHGGNDRTELSVGRASRRTVLATAALTAIATFFMYRYLLTVNDSAPFLDALTTCMSLGAQYLLTKKYIDNWPIWITADIIYVGLYASRHLYLTAVLYALFIVLCVVGYLEWRAELSRRDILDDGPVDAGPGAAGVRNE